MITCLLLSLLSAAGAGESAPPAPAALFYVSPDGNDAWSGRLDSPAADRSDGPFATVEGARDAIRRARESGTVSGPIEVRLRGGSYAITAPITFAPEDSGSEGALVTYAAYEGEQPIIDGGRRITGWRKEGNLWVADLPDVRDGRWSFSALWVNGERRQPARMPNPAHVAGDEPAESDYFYTEGPVLEKDPATGEEAKSATKFRYRAGDITLWENLDDAVVVVFHSWATSLLRIKSLDEVNNVVEFTGPARWPFGSWQEHQRYFVEHVFEGLDQPGEWYLNRVTGTLTYFPMPGEDPETAEVVAPIARLLLALEGSPKENRYVEHMRFIGIDFQHSEYPIEPEGHSDPQAAFSVGAAIETTGARHCVFERCAVSHVGTYGVWFRAGSQHNLLRQCEIADLGAGGVRIGEGGSPATPAEECGNNVVDNCFLHDGGRIFRSAVGVWIGRSSNNTISHNDICDFRYTGVSVGWSWGYDPSSANHNIIADNRIHHCGRGQLSDMGAIYTLGLSPGTELRGNVMHDILSYGPVSGGWGIYFDEGSTDILATNNLVYNTLTGTLHQHYGKDNRVVNNILAYSHREQLIRSREEEHRSFSLERNIILLNNGRLLGGRWQNKQYTLDSNCYWDTSGEPLDFQGRTLEEWQAEGNDLHSIVADPLFEDPEHADFRLEPDSPALALGFEPFDFDQTGLYGEPEWVNKPRTIQRPPFSPPPVPEPTTIHMSFEESPVGSRPSDVQVIEEGAATIRVSDEQAATGKQSLKFADAAGLAHAYNPHLMYGPGLRKGVAVASFAIRVAAETQFYHEWRDNRSPYRVGPSIWFDPDGAVRSQGQTLETIPVEGWTRVEIKCALGREASATYALELTLPDGTVREFKDLPCGSPDFNRLEWFGFVSNADGAVVTYLDDVTLELE